MKKNKIKEKKRKMLSNNLNKEKFYMEESEKEVLGQQIIEETTNRMRMEGIDRERFKTCIDEDEDDVDDDTDDAVEMDEIEGESNEEVFEVDDAETEEKPKG